MSMSDVADTQPNPPQPDTLTAAVHSGMEDRSFDAALLTIFFGYATADRQALGDTHTRLVHLARQANDQQWDDAMQLLDRLVDSVIAQRGDQ